VADNNTIAIQLALNGLSSVQTGITKLISSFNLVEASLHKIGEFTGLNKVGESLEQLAKLATELTRLKAITGDSIPNLVAIQKVLRETGGEADSVAQFVSRMQRSIANAVLEGGAQARGFTELGFSLAEISQLSTLGAAEQLQIIGRRIGALDNNALKASAAVAIFGREGRNMLTIFDNGKALDALTAGTDSFGNAMGRISHPLHEIEILLIRLKRAGIEFFAGILDALPLAELEHFAASILEAFNFTKIGQSIGDFIAVAIDQIRAGHFAEFLALTIEAGFERGVALAGKTWTAFTEFVTRPGPWAHIGTVILTEIGAAFAKTVNFFITGLLTLPTVMIANFSQVVDIIGDLLENAFIRAANSLGRAVFAVLNKAVSIGNKVFGTNVKGVEFKGAPEITPKQFAPVTHADAFEALGGDARSQAIDDFKELSIWASRVRNGIDEVFHVDGSASDTIKSLILHQSLLRGLNQLYQSTKEVMMNAFAGQAPIQQRFKNSLADEEKAKRRLLELDQERFDLDKDFTKTDAEKFGQRKAILQDEIDALEKISKLLQDRSRTPGIDENVAEQLRNRALQFDTQAAGKRRDLGGLGPDPNDWANQWEAAFTRFRAGTVFSAQNFVTGFSNIVESSLKSVGDAIGDVVTGVTNMGQAWAKIGLTVVRAITSMVATQIAGALAIDAVEQILHTKKVARNAVTASTGAAAGLGTASAEGGWVGALIYVGVYAAVLAAILALAAAATGGFAEGGRPPVGVPSMVGERGRELFVPDMAGLIIPNNQTERIVSGADNLQPAGGGTAIAFFDNRAEAMDWLDKQPARRKLMKIINEERHEVGI
jgi:hypothetical protein